jgi:hypothetical protein
VGSWLGSWADPQIARHLLRDEGEVVVDEVRHHWAAYARPAVRAVAGIALWVLAAVAPIGLAWLPMLLGLGFLVYAAYLALAEHRDRFVITNMRVFRVHGVFGQSLATMPLTRILDITVRRSLHGRLLGYGHFCFESAAQEQNVRDVRFVGRPYERDLAIQRVVQRSGLRGRSLN